jgi:hypothetical protein
MIIFWRKKASYNKKKGDGDEDGDDEGQGDEMLHIGFNLCKTNFEHLSAMQQVRVGN